jgi:hypothetical protein
LYSEQFNNAAWGTLGTITITPNATTSPSGDLSADLVLGLDSNSSVNQIISGTTGVVYTNSFYIKNNDSIQSEVFVRNSITAIECRINWTGAILSSVTNLTGVTTFQDVGDGWYRITSTYTSLEAAQRPRVLPSTLGSNQSVYLWGSQLEVGSNATSYIPTTTTAVTRVEDVASKTGISDLIGQTEGTLFVDYNRAKIANNSSILELGEFNNEIAIWQSATFQLRFFIRVNGSIFGSRAFNFSDERLKIALTYQTDSYSVFLNGVKILENIDITSLSNSYNGFVLGNRFIIAAFSAINSGINLTAIFKTKLSDAELTQLTTL